MIRRGTSLYLFHLLLDVSESWDFWSLLTLRCAGFWTGALLPSAHQAPVNTTACLARGSGAQAQEIKIANCRRYQVILFCRSEEQHADLALLTCSARWQRDLLRLHMRPHVLRPAWGSCMVSADMRCQVAGAPAEVAPATTCGAWLTMRRMAEYDKKRRMVEEERAAAAPQLPVLGAPQIRAQ